jgi:hypothetical protein
MTKHVEIYQTAVCDHTGSQQIFLNTSGSNSLYSAPNSPNTSDFIEVPTDTLLNIMDSHNLQTIDFLKMDCEGAEGKILKSMPPDIYGVSKKSQWNLMTASLPWIIMSLKASLIWLVSRQVFDGTLKSQLVNLGF